MAKKSKADHTQCGEAPRRDLHQTITDKVIAAIEAGAGEWVMPWHRPGTAFTIPKNALTGANYQGCNILSLWIDADTRRYATPLFATFKQWQQLGAQVRKGEKGSLIVKYGRWTPAQKSAPASAQGNVKSQIDGGEENNERMYARAAFVFNAEQVDGYQIEGETPRPDLTMRLAHVDEFLTATGIQFREGGSRAFYRQPIKDGSGDFVQMPPRNLFIATATSTATEAYEATRLHEAAHATGAAHRLNRELAPRFDTDAYAMEELIAELSACFLCAELQISNAPRADHAQYLAHWLKVLKADSRAIFTAASHATRAVRYLIDRQTPVMKAQLTSESQENPNVADEGDDEAVLARPA